MIHIATKPILSFYAVLSDYIKDFFKKHRNFTAHEVIDFIEACEKNKVIKFKFDKIEIEMKNDAN